MKKFRYIISFALILSFSLVFMSACDFGSQYKQFQVEYTRNLEFLIGEEYEDENIKGIATKRDGTTEDVTNTMETDTSEYNKNVAGTYKIYFEFADIRIHYEVKVVEEITNSNNVNLRLQEAINNTFKRDDNGLFSYEASISTEFLDSTYFNEYMIYEDLNGVIDIYLKYEIQSIEDPSNVQVAYEFWYHGTESLGEITLKPYGESPVVLDDQNIAGFNMHLYNISESLPVSIFALGIGDVSAELSDCTLILDENGYKINYEEDGFEGVIKYKDNIIYEVDGVSYNFPKPDSVIIPSIPQV